MVLRSSWWLLTVCLLSWWYDTWELGRLDPQAESPLPLVLWYERGDPLNMDVIEMTVEKELGGTNVLSLEIGKIMMEDVENKHLEVKSILCQILAENSKVYIDAPSRRRPQLLFFYSMAALNMVLMLLLF